MWIRAAYLYLGIGGLNTASELWTIHQLQQQLRNSVDSSNVNSVSHIQDPNEESWTISCEGESIPLHLVTPNTASEIAASLVESTAFWPLDVISFLSKEEDTKITFHKP
mmetsp:Transcript_26517/g.67889  ORF Transcript_26517/g.67889 Transcript_26517/m.67889 type:complete len:109 (+) Transcript_26517:478-804(+)|eukprot:CAMPEP_0113902758 /NCGR_PEP_ID=MMETSP0780_2-20120614/22043_1 /TAXON_ID=652834 /ORGANISM="Palpitomonas bilix" /LENGTH=108 /DNA_ID=CAMNT_0000895629 /DNA_START=384 /DNA_END=710 /DNA_ORIENTATION=- /assembly_acc=CAM_ASM_000599